MRKYVLLLVVVFNLSCTIAQGTQTVKETFETNKYGWDEFFEKNCSASVQDGFLELQSKEDGAIVRSIVDMPVNIESDFKISTKMIATKINDKSWFGLLYNYEDENNYSCFFIQESRFEIVNKANGIISLSRRGGLILKSGKNKEVNIIMEKNGGKLLFTVDNMEVIAITKLLTRNAFGFCIKENNTIKVDEVIVEQQIE